MSVPALRYFTIACVALFMTGCAANEDLSIQTGSVKKAPEQTKFAADPVCVALWSNIQKIQGEGTPDRVSKVSEGKTKTVVVKRSSLATMAKLTKLNRDFNAKCSTFTPAQTAQRMPNHVPISTDGQPAKQN